MHLLTIILSFLLLPFTTAQASASTAFCPWCLTTIPDSIAQNPEFLYSSYCHAFVHQPILASDVSTQNKKTTAVHVAIMNNNMTELLSYGRMVYDGTSVASVDLPTKPTRCVPGVATVRWFKKEEMMGGEGGTLNPPEFMYSVQSERNYSPPQIVSAQYPNGWAHQAPQVQPTAFALSQYTTILETLVSKMLPSLLPSSFLLLISTLTTHASPVRPFSESDNAPSPANSSLPLNTARATETDWNSWSNLSERFCPWCEAGITSSSNNDDAPSPEEKVCRVVVHQPMASTAASTPLNRQFIDVAILNSKYEELLSYRRTGWGQQEDVWTSVPGVGEKMGVATVFVGERGVEVPPKILWQTDGKLSVTILPLAPSTEGSKWKVVKDVAPKKSYLVFHTWFFCGN
ncbi:hypothetical protein B0T20DRAFT_446385 [Sordaria brevicollis]|uniref:Uncharacterized protein n=1 Tax=Sordaria brevicollis TaxID=83679 RepID=A0AAE0U5H5_SORBR|nr:hypothetical protein B0T20DRAFT_446385 [Sordaria brevicollis]